MWERRVPCVLLAALFALEGAASAAVGDLEASIGRSEIRVYSAAYELRTGLSVGAAGLADRLEALGYRRVRERPQAPGQFFWGHEVLWIYRRPYRRQRRLAPAALLELPLERAGGRIRELPAGVDPVLEPALLAESLDGARAPRLPVELAELPEHVWRSVLAAEDARFFDHPGVDVRALSRAALRNAQAGRVVQGGSTITQQLIKNRDLTPRRRVGRKLSEAVRALRLEGEHSKEEILQAYLNSVYFGHVGGLALHGVGAAARAYFGKSAARLGLGESALLAALIQGWRRHDAAACRDWRCGRRRRRRREPSSAGSESRSAAVPSAGSGRAVEW
jgi:penicillin-binding protein 1B